MQEIKQAFDGRAHINGLTMAGNDGKYYVGVIITNLVTNETIGSVALRPWPFIRLFSKMIGLAVWGLVFRQ